MRILSVRGESYLKSNSKYKKPKSGIANILVTILLMNNVIMGGDILKDDILTEGRRLKSQKRITQLMYNQKECSGMCNFVIPFSVPKLDLSVCK